MAEVRPLPLPRHPTWGENSARIFGRYSGRKFTGELSSRHSLFASDPKQLRVVDFQMPTLVRPALATFGWWSSRPSWTTTDAQRVRAPATTGEASPDANATGV